MPLLHEFKIKLPRWRTYLTGKLYTSPNRTQLLPLVRIGDNRIGINAPVLFWADCSLSRNYNLLAVGFSQVMTKMNVEFIYTMPNQDCIAELNLQAMPCNDGGHGIWYSTRPGVALQILGESYPNIQHTNDKIFYDIFNPAVITAGGDPTFPYSKTSKRVMLSDSPFINLPEDGVCDATNTKIPAAPMGTHIILARNAPTLQNNTPLIANSQLAWVKGRYTFETKLCLITQANMVGVANSLQASAIASIHWELNISAPFAQVRHLRDWSQVGPMRILQTGSRIISSKTVQSEAINRVAGVPCNLRNRSVRLALIPH